MSNVAGAGARLRRCRAIFVPLALGLSAPLAELVEIEFRRTRPALVELSPKLLFPSFGRAGLRESRIMGAQGSDSPDPLCFRLRSRPPNQFRRSWPEPADRVETPQLAIAAKIGGGTHDSPSIHALRAHFQPAWLIKAWGWPWATHHHRCRMGVPPTYSPRTQDSNTSAVTQVGRAPRC